MNEIFKTDDQCNKYANISQVLLVIAVVACAVHTAGMSVPS